MEQGEQEEHIIDLLLMVLLEEQVNLVLLLLNINKELLNG